MTQVSSTTAKPSFDPKTQPVVGACNLAPLSEQELTAEFIRTAFTQAKRINWQVEPLYTHAFVKDFREHPQSIQSAVCVGIIQHQGTLHVLFTKRAEHLPHHAGQVSFPGGRIEQQDADAVAAALRETHEEVGIAPAFIEPIAEQPIFLTSTRFAMRPVVSLLHEGYRLQPNPQEVAEIFVVPLVELLNPRRHTIHHLPRRFGREGAYFSIAWEGQFIWGATAALVRNLYHFLSAAARQL